MEMKDGINIPKNLDIVNEAMMNIRDRHPGMLERNFIKTKFSDAVEEVFKTAYEKYCVHEQNAINVLAADRFTKLWKEKDRKKALEIFHNAMHDAIGLEKSLRQSRVARAGKSFEITVQVLLKMVGINSEHVTKAERARLGRIDLVIPDRRTAIDAPDQAHFLSLKTTLRERWKQVVQEQRQGQRTHLLTILQKDETVSANIARDIVDSGMFLYIPDRIKKSQFPDESRIRGLSDLPASVK